MRISTRELSTATWPDYEHFFSQGNGWDHCGCLAYQGLRPPPEERRWADKRDWALRVKQDLVVGGRTHGVLVYEGSDPVGWCQYGPTSELPLRPESQTVAVGEDDRRWRITCFCVAPTHRGRGVADTALAAAVRSIGRAGGGNVTATPVVSLPNDPGLDELVRDRGVDDPDVLAHARDLYGASSVVAYDRRAWSVGGVVVDGFGPLWASVRPRRLTGSHRGTVELFTRHGFTATAVLDPGPVKLPASALVMERDVSATRPTS